MVIFSMGTIHVLAAGWYIKINKIIRGMNLTVISAFTSLLNKVSVSLIIKVGSSGLTDWRKKKNYKQDFLNTVTLGVDDGQGTLASVGSQWVGHDGATELNWPPKSNSLGVLSLFAGSPRWEICCGS